MKKKVMIMMVAGLIAAGSAEAAFASEKKADDKILQFIEQLKDYIAGYIEDKEDAAEPAPEVSGAEALRVIDLTNAERRAAGLPGLAASGPLSRIAQKKAEDMARNGYFSHTSPTYGSAFDMLEDVGISYSAAGENLAKGQSSAQAAVNGWMNSSAHRDNILGSKYTATGVGVAKNGKGTTYWVQVFIGK